MCSVKVRHDISVLMSAVNIKYASYMERERKNRKKILDSLFVIA